MRRCRAEFARGLVCLLSLLTSLLLTEGALADGGTRRALLIGINDYERLPALRGAVNDVETIQALLETQFGFEPQHTRLLTNKQATRAGILAALEQLVDEAGRADTVYIHYSGHGSQVRDANNDEADGLDETICPQDARTPGIADITDDELDAIIERLRVSSAVVVLDSCHSGTGLRDAAVDIRARFVPPDTRLELYALATRTVVPLPISERYLLFTGAAANESALDGPFEGRYHGLFTFALSRGLSGAPRQITPLGVMKRVEQALQGIKPRLGGRRLPEPQLEGARDRLEQPLFGAAPQDAAAEAVGSARVPWVQAQPENGSLRLVKGVELGAHPQSIWAVYPPGETRFLPGKGLLRAVVREAVGADALATPSRPDAPLLRDSRAVLIAAPPPPERVPILLRAMTPPVRAQLREALESLLRGGVAFVEPGQFARFVIDCPGGEERWSCGLFGAQGETELAGLDAAPGQIAESIAVTIARSTAVAARLSVENPSARLRINLTAVGATPRVERSIGTRGIRVSADLAPQPLRFYTPGEARTPANSLQLEVGTSQDCYLTVVDVDARAGTNLLFPSSYQKSEFLPQGLIRAGTTSLIPDSLAPGNGAGFYFDYGPPAGLDTVRAICATRLEDAESIRSAIGELSAAGPGSVADSNRVLRLRRELASTSSDWAAASLYLSISEN